MQNLQPIIDFLLQTPTNHHPRPYIPPILAPSGKSRLYHVQRTITPIYDDEYPDAIILPNTSLQHGLYTIHPIPPSFIPFCNEQILDIKVDFDPGSLLNITSIISRPWGFENLVGFRLSPTQAESILDRVTSNGFLDRECNIYPIHIAFQKHTSERLIDFKIEWDMHEHLRHTIIISRAQGFEDLYDVPLELHIPVTYNLPDPIPLSPTNPMILQVDWNRSS